MCLSFIWIFQSISCRNMMLPSCWPIQIYILLLCQTTWYFLTDVSCEVFSGYAYNWVHLWFLQFPKKIVLPYNMYVFSILPFMFLWFLTYINLLLSTFFSYHILFHALCLYLLHKSTPVYHTCTYTVMYCVCHLHKIYIYIWDIYICINFYCAIHFTSYSYCHPKNHTRVHQWYMSWNE